MKNQITIFDTSVATNNAGDEIIMDAVNKQLFNIFKEQRICRVASHDKIGIPSLSIIKHSDYTFVGGSNILSSKMNKYKQWRLDLLDYVFLPSNVITLGVGWRKYQEKTNFPTKKLLKKILNKEYYHSVRENYTKDKLEEIGITNVLNTGCPTMWELEPEHCKKIPQEKSENVVFTLTDYDQSENLDKKFIATLKKTIKRYTFGLREERI